MDYRISEAAKRFRTSWHEDEAKALAEQLRRVWPNEENKDRELELPIDDKGKVIFHKYYYYMSQPANKRNNYIFADVLQFKGIRQTGAKAPRIILYSPLDSMEYEVYSRDSERIISHMERGWLIGRFTFLSRGRYIALDLEEWLDV